MIHIDITVEDIRLIAKRKPVETYKLEGGVKHITGTRDVWIATTHDLLAVKDSEPIQFSDAEMQVMVALLLSTDGELLSSLDQKDIKADLEEFFDSKIGIPRPIP